MTFAGTASGADGAFVIEAAATDAAGNVGRVQSTVTIDSTAPVITVSAPAAGVATSATSVEIRGTVQDLTPVSFSIDGAPVALGAGGSFSWEGALGEVEGPRTFALLATGFLGLALIKHDTVIAARTLALAADGTVSDYVFATVPMFVLMGLFVNVSDVGRDAFRAAQRIFGRIHGGLGVATVAANAVFAAITGISIRS